MEMNLFVREYEMEKMRDVRDMALHGEEVWHHMLSFLVESYNFSIRKWLFKEKKFT
jgi:hypothetical protein